MAAELSIRQGKGRGVHVGTVLVERNGMFAYIVNGPDRLSWGYYEQSYRVNLIQQKRKHGSFMEKLWFSKPSQKHRFRK